MLNEETTTNESLYGDLKEPYLATIKESTRVSYARIFKITKTFEDKWNKDIKDFTQEQIEEVLISFNANNRNTIETYARIISSYLNWAVAERYVATNILKDYKPEDFDKFLLDPEGYIAEKKLEYLEDNCVNAQDKVILRLLFIGVGGRQLSEIRNLKKTDIDEVNMQLKLTSTLKEEKGYPTRYIERHINIDERTLKLLKDAIKQKQYIKRNGMMVENEHVRPYTDLAENEFVIRQSLTLQVDDPHKPTDKYVIYRRIATVAETMNIDITSKFLQRSGMLWYMKSVMQDDTITLEDIKIVANRFGMTSYHNLKPLLTLENVKKTNPN